MLGKVLDIVRSWHDGSCPGAPPDAARAVARFELRAWGAAGDRARGLLGRLAGPRQRERLVDHYVLLADRADCVKVRDGRLKVKWALDRPAGLTAWSAPCWADLRRGRRSKSPAGDAAGAQPAVVTVHKERERFLLDGVVAEVTRMTLPGPGHVMHTVGIEGPDLRTVLVLARRLQLDPADNRPVHHALEDLTPGDWPGSAITRA